MPYHIISCGTKSCRFNTQLSIENRCWKSGEECVLKILYHFRFYLWSIVLTRALIWVTLKIAQCTYHTDFVRRIKIFLKPSLFEELWCRKRGRREGTGCRSRIANTVYREELQQRQDLNSLNFYFLNLWQYVTFERYWESPRETWVTLTLTNVNNSWEHLAGHQKPLKRENFKRINNVLIQNCFLHLSFSVAVQTQQ